MKYTASILVVLAMMWTPTAPAASGSVEMRLRALESRLPDADRLAAIEKSFGSQGAGILADEVDQLKAEIRELRGQIEQLTHQFNKQQQGQQKLYGDIDKRLQALEAKAAVASSVSPSVTSATALEDTPTSDTGEPAGSRQERADYLAAFELLQQGNTTEAIGAYQGFLDKYPRSSYASNALYWLGEANYVSKNYPQALAEFQKLAEEYPDSPKLSGALLKIGYIHYETRHYTEARMVLERVKSGFPNTNVSTLATERLERMRKEGV
ncbi:MAG: tol-pal system protein YbgF [Nevskiales bacterium]